MEVLTPSTPATTTEVTTPNTETEAPKKEDAGKEPSGEKKPEEEVPEYKKVKHKVKVNGKEAEVDYDELVKRYQLAEAAEERFQSAAKMRQEADSIKQQLAEYETDPWAYMAKHGKDPYQAAEQLLLRKLQWEQMSEEQRALEIEKQKRIELEKRIEDMTAKERQDALAKAETQAIKEIDDEISEAVTELGVKPTPALIAQIAATLLSYHEAGKQVTAKEVVKRVRDQISTSAREMISSMSVEDLRAFLPKGHLDGLRKAAVDSALAQDPMRSRKPKQADDTSPRAPKGPISTDSYFAKLDQKFKQAPRR